METKIPRKTFVPIDNLVCIYAFPVTETDTGLILPENAQGSWETPRALVISCGPTCKWVKEGDTVLVGASTMATKMRHRGHNSVVLPETSIIGVIIPVVE